MSTIRKRVWRTAKGEERQAWIVDYFDQGGVRRLKTFDRKAKADMWRTTALHEVKQRTHVPESTTPTVRDAAEAWIGRGEAEKLESSTMRQRRLHVDRHILPLLGADTKLSKIDVEVFRDELLRTRSRAMAKKVMTSLKAVLKKAKMAHLGANVEKIKTGGRHKKRLEAGVDIPEPAEFKALLDATADDPKAHALACLAGFAGLRASEIRGLAWPRLELGDHPVVTIAERADEQNALGSPKSDASKRTIRLNETTVKALRAWKLAQPPIVTQDDGGNQIRRPRNLVFGTAADRPDGLPNIRRRLMIPAWIKAGVARPVLDAAGKPVKDRKGQPVMRAKYTGAHALRHFAISSWLRTCNGDFKAVQTRAGHATLTLTVNLYGHLLSTKDGDQIDAAEKLVLG
jgi:integrase